MRRLLGGGGGSSGPVDWLIVGLGNPGERYARTPHNVGFAVAELLASRWELPRPRQRYAGLFTEGRTGPGGPRVAILWPQTYMNEAGRSAGPARGALHVALDRVLVVHDEIDLRFGEVRTRIGGGLAGHNGLKSLRQGLGSADFARVRVGVGRPDSTDPDIVAAYVLGRWRQSTDEIRALVEAAAGAAQRIVPGETALLPRKRVPGGRGRQVRRRRRGGLVLGSHRGPDLLAVHRDGAGRVDPDAHGVAGDLDHLDGDVLADDDLLAGPAGHHEHRGSSLDSVGLETGTAGPAASGDRLGEQWRAHRQVAGLVDHLEAAAARDHDGGAEVRGEVLRRPAGPDGHVDVGVRGVAQADALGLRVRQLDLVVGEEVPRPRHGEREVRILHRVQPHEGPVRAV